MSQTTILRRIRLWDGLTCWKLIWRSSVMQKLIRRWRRCLMSKGECGRRAINPSSSPVQPPARQLGSPSGTLINETLQSDPLINCLSRPSRIRDACQSGDSLQQSSCPNRANLGTMGWTSWNPLQYGTGDALTINPKTVLLMLRLRIPCPTDPRDTSREASPVKNPAPQTTNFKPWHTRVNLVSRNPEFRIATGCMQTEVGTKGRYMFSRAKMVHTALGRERISREYQSLG